MIHDQTQAFLEENKILYRIQSGFNKTFSTDSCLSYLNESDLNESENGRYLSNRKFKVNFNKTFSEPGKLLCGVPQGSILGLLLFLLYINDMLQAVKCELPLYADDTCLLFQHGDIKLKSNLIRTLV